MLSPAYLIAVARVDHFVGAARKSLYLASFRWWRSRDRTYSRNIRLHRLARGMTQVQLGAALGITFQQVQKYERGAISSGRLLRIAEILKVDVRLLLGVADRAEEFPAAGSSPIDLIAEPQSLRLATIFASIEDAELRRAVVAIAERAARMDERVRKGR